MKQRTLSVLIVIAAFAMISALVPTVSAQTSRGTVTGIVTDQQDAVVGGAEVELRSKATNQSRTTTTNDSGYYRFDAVDVGIYDVIIRAKGFRTVTNTGVQVQANLTSTIEAKMEVGTSEVVVDVSTSGAELLQTSEPVKGGNFSALQVSSLPSANLNPYDLARLLPGVTTASGGAQFGNASQFSINGQRPRGNNYLIDGTENNDISVTGPANQINNEDAVGEVSVQTGLFSAEFGRAGGGVFNLVTKGGTNEYHGTIKWLYLSQVFNSLTNTEKAVSRITRDGANGTPKFSVFDENVFGGTFGGPLPMPLFGEGGKAFLRGKDRNWFFFGLQFDRFHSTALQQPRIPTAAGVAALRALFPAGTNPRVDLYLATIGDERGVPTQSPVNVALGTGPNGAGVTVARGSIETALANVGLPNFFFDHQWVVRTDHSINDKHKVSMRYTADASIQNLQSFAVHPDFTIDFNGISRNLLFTHTWIMSSSMTNELRVSPYGLINFQFPYATTASAAARTLQNISFGGSGGLSTLGLATNLPQGRKAKNFLIQDALTKVWNSHTFRMGFEILKQTARQRPPFNERGSFGFASNSACNPPTCPVPVPAFTGFANFVDNFSGSSGTANINFGIPFYTPNLLRESYFIQDTWKVKPNFTLTLGTRYEDFGQPANNAFKFPAFAGFDPAQFLVPNKVKRDRNNFGPIFGFAYTPQWESGPIAWLLPKDRSVIRGGYQISYDTWFNNLLSNIAADSPNNTSTTTTGAAVGRGTANFFPGAIPSTPVSPSASNSQTSVFNPNIRNPYTQRWSLGFQRELPFGLFMDASYVGSAGRKLFVSEDLNPIVNPSTGARLFTTVGIRRWRTSGADSEYNSGQLRIDKRFSHGLQFGTSYTWSKNMDSTSEVFATGNTQSALAVVPAFLGGLKLDWGPSDYHRKHRFVTSFVWDLPFLRGNNSWAGKLLGGWQLNGILSFQSGAPFTIANGRDRNGDGQVGPDRPDLGNPNAPHNTRAVVVAAGTCASLLQNPDTVQCVTRNDVYVVQVAAATGTTNVFPGSAMLGRNTERSKPVQNLDMSLFKIFRLGENLKLEYRVEAFNVLNHPQQTGLPGLDVTNTTAGRFLNYDFVSGGRRSARMGLKIIF
jgi:hypothetical protein